MLRPSVSASAPAEAFRADCEDTTASQTAGRFAAAPPSPQPPSPAWQKTGDVLADYSRARDLGQTGSDLFLRNYMCQGLSCVNLDERRYDTNAVLHFEQQARGMFLGVEQDGQVLVMPALDKDLTASRGSFEIVFTYVERGGPRARVSQPAVCVRSGDGWVMQRSGEVELV